MRARLLVLLVAVAACAASPAAAQSGAEAPTKGDGGLHVSDGGMVGYVGGSGSISGTVRGPGGSGGSGAPAPKPAVADAGPSAITDGKVTPARISVPDASDAIPARSESPWRGPLIAAAMLAVTLVVLFVRPKRLTQAR